MGEWSKKYWIYITLGALILNSLVLNTVLLLSSNKPSPRNIVSETINSLQTPPNSCPQSCTDQINSILSQKQSSASSVTKIVIPTFTPTPVATSAPTSAPTPAKTVREFFVPLGQGSGNSGDWAVVTGIGAKVNTSDYGDIKTVTFETTLRIPNGNQIVWIRLYNANTFQMVPGSELTLSSGTPTLLISQPISLTSGDNLYQIQMKTQLQSTANIDMARLRIKTN